MINNGSGGIHIFGVRHLSPAGAHHLLAFLDRIQPELVLVEGPSDASGLISQLADRDVRPPVALLAYTDQLPVRSLLYPFAVYSPEYQAFRWALENGAQAAFMDLPTGVTLALNKHREQSIRDSGEETEEEPEKLAARRAYYKSQGQLYEQIALLSGAPDYESYWERMYEHNEGQDAYRSAIAEYSASMRRLNSEAEWTADPYEAAYTEIREAYMRRVIRQAIDAGTPPHKIVAVTGAHHVSALDVSEQGLPPMDDKECKSLPASSVRLTLMPYSYYKLSSRSGYGAGNPAPAYYELLWDCLRKEDTRRLPSLYLSKVARALRRQGVYRSTASVIEGVRLAEALASMHNGILPTWKDLRDAAVVSLGHGELSVIAEALASADVGTAIGQLPEGVSQTPIQDDLNRHLKRLKLEAYKSTVRSDLELDLRENRRVKTREAAFLDLERSYFLHRLALLDTGFAEKAARRQDAASWAEHWMLQWSPEAEIKMVESTLMGETIELAAAYLLKEQLEQCTDIRQASRLVRTACECGLTGCMDDAKAAMQRLAVDAGSFAHTAGAARELSMIIRYGDIRRVDTAALVPLMQQLFLRGSLLLTDAAACSEAAVPEMLEAIHDMHAVSQEQPELIDESTWLDSLHQLAGRDDRNARLSGLAFALLLERNLITREECEREVSRRLSPGIPADLGAGWFEGLSMRNRYALLSRTDLWRQLNEYISSLEENQFNRSLVFLRRAFGSFEPREKAAVAELLGEFWGGGALPAAEALQEPLSEEERGKLDELNDFDFGDL
jgi:hypothetical protein